MFNVIKSFLHNFIFFFRSNFYERKVPFSRRKRNTNLYDENVLLGAPSKSGDDYGKFLLNLNVNVITILLKKKVLHCKINSDKKKDYGLKRVFKACNARCLATSTSHSTQTTFYY